jgi:hypothetical protein
MKEVKLLGLTDRWAIDIQDYRVKELNLSKKARTLSLYRFVLGRYPLYSRILLVRYSNRWILEIKTKTDCEHSENIGVSYTSNNFWGFHCHGSAKRQQPIRLDGFYIALTLVTAHLTFVFDV